MVAGGPGSCREDAKVLPEPKEHSVGQIELRLSESRRGETRVPRSWKGSRRRDIFTLHTPKDGELFLSTAEALRSVGVLV